MSKNEDTVAKASAEIFDSLVNKIEKDGPMVNNEIYAHIYRDLSDKILDYDLSLDEQKYVIFKVIDFINEDKRIQRKSSDEVTVH